MIPKATTAAATLMPAIAPDDRSLALCCGLPVALDDESVDAEDWVEAGEVALVATIVPPCNCSAFHLICIGYAI